jgi:hypothetical protein
MQTARSRGEGVGTRDHMMSRSYNHVTLGKNEPCNFHAAKTAAFAEVRAESAGGALTQSGTICEECHYWLPFDLMSHVGQCDNPSSRYYRRAAFSDKPTEGCFAKRSLEGLEFMWCQSHRQTIYSSELPDHRGCRIFVTSVSLPVEDEMELTLAAD